VLNSIFALAAAHSEKATRGTMRVNRNKPQAAADLGLEGIVSKLRSLKSSRPFHVGLHRSLFSNSGAGVKLSLSSFAGLTVLAAVEAQLSA
jgi:hypothetical protein